MSLTRRIKRFLKTLILFYSKEKSMSKKKIIMLVICILVLLYGAVAGFTQRVLRG